MVNYKDKLQEAIQLTLDKGYEQTRAEWLLLDLLNGHEQTILSIVTDVSS